MFPYHLCPCPFANQTNFASPVCFIMRTEWLVKLYQEYHHLLCIVLTLNRTIVCRMSVRNERTNGRQDLQHQSSATQEAGLLSEYWRAAWQQTGSRGVRDKWRFGTAYCLIRTHAESSVRLHYKGESDVGLWVFVLTSGALCRPDNCHHAAASILMWGFAKLKRRAVCGGAIVWFPHIQISFCRAYLPHLRIADLLT
jgi:hypothetical protein